MYYGPENILIYPCPLSASHSILISVDYPLFFNYLGLVLIVIFFSQLHFFSVKSTGKNHPQDET
jgi:hypothetical protein